MRHGKKFNHLGRKAGHRRALLRNLSIALITHKRINTTLAKAKALRKHIEPLITKSKTNTTHSRRVAFSYLQDKEAVKELFGPIAEKVADRPGGYVRVIRTGFRRSDGAEMAMIEMVDFNEVYSTKEGKKSGGSGRRRTRRGGSSQATQQPANKTVAAEEEE
jgi:large subunit ribosomal protein L17